jgi:hypothetical protein
MHVCMHVCMHYCKYVCMYHSLLDVQSEVMTKDPPAREIRARMMIKAAKLFIVAARNPGMERTTRRKA